MNTLNVKKIVLLIIGLVVVGIGIWSMRYLGLDRSLPEAGVSVIISEEKEAQKEMPPSNSLTPQEYVLDTVASGLFVPWSIAFTAPERILVAERNGTIRVILNEALLEKPLHQFTVHTGGEEGLMGMTLDPEYPQNKFVYFSYAVGNDENMRVKVVRLTDRDDRLSDETVILDTIPAAKYHAGSRIAFGPDGKLYISTGDATEKNLAQDKNSLAGKIIRMNSDGSIPSDNPDPDSLIWSLGHRNPQGLAWHKQTGALFSTEHGPSVFDGPAGGDEINQIEPGKNYGWPIVSHEKSDSRFVDPLLVFTPAVAPASALLYSGRVFAQYEDNLFFGGLKGEGLFRVTLSPTTPHRALSYEKLLDGVGRVREVMEGPDGLIYFTTSNRDGRGSVQTGDDHLYRLIPVK